MSTGFSSLVVSQPHTTGDHHETTCTRQIRSSGQSITLDSKETCTKGINVRCENKILSREEIAEVLTDLKRRGRRSVNSW